MGNGKQSKEGQAARRRQIIEYIGEHGPVRSGQICAALGLSRSSLSDDIREINVSEKIIISPARGTYTLAPEAEMREQASRVPYSRIDRRGVRRWMILFALQRHSLTFAGILSFLENAGITCTESSLRRDVADLTDDGLVTRRSEGRQIFYESSCIRETDRREMRHYRESALLKNSRIRFETARSIDRKLAHACPDPDAPAPQDGSDDARPSLLSLRSAGRRNTLTGTQLGMLRQIERLPYETQVLEILYRTNSGKEILCRLQTGIIVYVVETARIYLIGRDENKRYAVIPTDRIRDIRAGQGVNTCCNTPEFNRIFREMFQISTDVPVKVRVRFQNYGFIREKVERLCANRKQSKTEIAGDEIIYTDTIRGEEDFARYLRRFGKSAIVDAPLSLRERMMRSSRLILALYGAAPLPTPEEE